MKPLLIVAVVLTVACTRSGDGHLQVASTSTDSVRTSAVSIASVMATLDAYSEKSITADAAAKVIVAYIINTGQSLNVEMDAALRDAVTREMKARGR